MSQCQSKVQPTGPFLYVKFVQGDGSLIVLPDGTKDPNGDIVVQAVGPDVPSNQGIIVGSKVLLRGDAKIFGTTSEERGPACIDYRSVMAVVVPESDADCPPLTDEEMAKILPVDR